VQNEDGSWSGDAGGYQSPGGHATSRYPTAMTAFALLAFLGDGRTPENTKEFGAVVDRGLKWLLAGQREDGRFKHSDGHRYSLPIATIVLCEAYALTGDEVLKEAAVRSAQVVLDGANEDGGWNYNCDRSGRNDTSYSGWCAQAVIAARDAEIPVKGIELACLKAIRGFKTNSARNGGFSYVGGDDSTRLTGVGVSCLQRLGRMGCAEVKRGLEWIHQNVNTNWEQQPKRPLYYWYYETQANFQSGGDSWKAWNKRLMPKLVDHQTVIKDGGFDGKDIGYWKSIGYSENYGYVYNTALCTMMLEVYYRHRRLLWK